MLTTTWLPAFFNKAQQRGFELLPEHQTEMLAVGAYLEQHDFVQLGPYTQVVVLHAKVAPGYLRPAWSAFYWHAILNEDEHEWVVKVTNESRPRICFHAEPVNCCFWLTRSSEFELILKHVLEAYKERLLSVFIDMDNKELL